MTEGEDPAAQADRAEEDTAAGAREIAARRRQRLIVCAIVAAVLCVLLPPLFAWQSDSQQKALSLSNMRRVANGCLIYMQDWDERMPPPFQTAPGGFVVSWPRLVRPYVVTDDAFSNPSNPVKPFAEKPLLRDPDTGRAIDTSYALNARFWGDFGPGAFPVGNLEIPEQTALLVEAGRMAADPRRPHLPGASTPGISRDLYNDTTDRVQSLSPYPSVHGGQFGIVAGDGHGVMTKVLYYGPGDGPHDARYGRIGDTIYDWNGGHPNGETDRPARE